MTSRWLESGTYPYCIIRNVCDRSECVTSGGCSSHAKSVVTMPERTWQAVYRKVSSVGQMKLRCVHSSAFIQVIFVCVFDVNLGSDIFNSVSYLETETELLAQNCCILFDSLCCHCINTNLMFCWNRIMVAHISSATQHVLQEIPMNWI